MCEWGTHELVEVTVAADLSHTGEAYVRPFGIDACIAPLVRALNAGGLVTRQSCCGHGKGPGRIDLADGRTLRIESAAPQGIAGDVTTEPDDHDHRDRRGAEEMTNAELLESGFFTKEGLRVKLAEATRKKDAAVLDHRWEDAARHRDEEREIRRAPYAAETEPVESDGPPFTDAQAARLAQGLRNFSAGERASAPLACGLTLGCAFDAGHTGQCMGRFRPAPPAPAPLDGERADYDYEVRVAKANGYYHHIAPWIARLSTTTASLTAEREARHAAEQERDALTSALETAFARDGQWINFAFRVGDSVQCLASTFPDGNEHIEKRVALAEQEREQLASIADAAADYHDEHHVPAIIGGVGYQEKVAAQHRRHTRLLALLADRAARIARAALRPDGGGTT